MESELKLFEAIARRAFPWSAPDDTAEPDEHPFERRNIHASIATVSRKLFDDAHYSQATFEAFKLLDNTVAKLAASSDRGEKLMNSALSDASPLVRLTPCSTTSEKDEQRGYRYLFAGSIVAIRNPRGHENIVDTPDTCLDHLTLASVLFRRLSAAGFSV